MSRISKSRLLATSAIAGLSILHLSAPAHAQESFGIHNDQPDPLEISVGEEEDVEGGDIGIYADNGPVIVDNAGAIRGNGNNPGGADSRPSAGITIAQPGSSITNSGEITGAGSGIATSYFFSEDEEGENLPPQPLAADTTVVNTGLISGEAGAGVSLTGGGSVTNDGTIRGMNGFPGSGVNGIGVAISEFPDAIAEGVTGVGSVVNTGEGLIEGQTFGVILQGGGTIENNGTIRATGQLNPAIPGSQTPFGVVIGAAATQEGRTGTLDNGGLVQGFLGVLAGGAVETVTINNDGIINAQALGIVGQSTGDLIVNNGEDGQILVGGNAIAANTSTLTVNNEGLIQSQSQNAINILTAGALIDNSGIINAGGAGIITNAQSATPTAPAQFVAFNATVNNSGSITGTNNDGIRLAGGGTVTNSGTITGVSSANNAAGTDGVSIFNQPDQADYVARVTNSETGVISGASRGVIVSGGGTIDNAGSITGGTYGAILQNGAVTEEGEPVAGVGGSVMNSGSITGNGAAGLLVGSGLETSEVANSGSITGVAGDGVLIDTMTGGTTTIDNAADGEIIGASSGVSVVKGGLALTNAGSIRGDGRGDGISAPPNGGVAISGESSTITNSGEISGAQFGIVTFPSFDPATGIATGTVVDTTIVNSGTITGENDDGVRLAGGGTITNSGTIQGVGQNAFGGTDGVSIFSHNDQDLATYSGVLVNEEGGVISGLRAGAALSSGGSVTNAGTITGQGQGVFIQGNALDGVEREGQVATLVNSGTISGTGNFGGTTLGGHGVSFGSNLETATLTNSGTITSDFAEGVAQASLADLTVTNEAGGVIEGGTSGIYSGATGTITVVNAGTIRGNGTYDGFAAPPDAGITIGTAGSSVDNSGTISGAGAGITTASQFDEETGQLVGLAVDTQILNSGTIIGEANDGVRLIGGGSVTNSGTIRAEAGDFADGISMYAYADQASEDFRASVANTAGGEISGSRFGIILSGGGAVENAGDIAGVNGGIFIQGTALDSGDRSGLTASVVNSGTISGSRADGINGYGVGFGSDLATASLDNSGTISSEAGAGVFHGTLGDVTISNAAGATIEGGTHGVYAGGEGSLTLDNTGTIRGNGTYEGADAPADAGVMVQSAGAAINNSGTISGAGYGVVTQLYFNDETGQTEIRAVGTQVTNSGTIRGDANDAVRLFGGGSVVNSGTIEGVAGELTDGITIQAFGGQDTSGSTMLGSVVNEAGGTISGERYGVLAVSGASVENAGTITGGLTGVVIGRQNSAGKEGVLVNNGTINGGVLIDVDSATATNGGAIVSETGIGFSSLGQIALVNSGTLAGGSGIAAQLSAFDDSVTLKTGSAISGVVDAGDGIDSLVLDGDVLELTEVQQLTAASGFETLEVAAGYWSTDGFVGEFGSVAIDEGGALQVNEISLESEGETVFSTPIFTPSIVNNGLLAVNFSENDAVSGLGELSVTGTGAVQLLGEAVFTLDTDSFAHTGGTIVSNGGLVLTGTLLGDVRTGGDGFFQLGAGGTEGNFAGDIVNDGTFVFNRSDDYDFLGAFSGSGTLTKMGDSILSFLGDYRFSGTTNILAGSVRIAGAIDPETEFDLGSGTLDLSAGGDQTIGGLSGGEESTVEIGETTLTVNQQGNTMFGGNISGEGGLVKDGDGTLNLTGTNTYTGPTTVDGGKLAVNGSISSPVTVNPDGTLGGNGEVGDTTIDGGTLAPGNSIGRLTVNGDLNFAAGSTYEVEVNAAGQADRVDATGAVTIASTAAVEVLAEDGNYNPRTDYVILTGAGGVTGTFGSVITDLAFLDPLLRYGANSVTLSLYRNDIDFADVAANANQAGVAAAVQSLGIDNLFFETVLVQNAATAQATFGDLSGEILASTVSGLNDDSRNLRGALLGLKAPEEGGAFVWGSAFGSWGDFDASGASYAMDADNKGFVTGIGFGGNGFAAALSAGIGGSDFKFGGRADRADVESKYLAAHATYGKGDGLRAAFGVSYAWHDIDTTRGITVAPLAQTLTSKRDADTLQVFGELGYDVVSGKMLLTPFIRLAHVSTAADAATEAGGAAALIVGKTEAKTTFLSLGGRIQFNATEPGFQPYASLAWNRAFDDRVGAFGARLAAGGPAFTIVGTEIPKNSAEVEAGFEYSTGNFRIGAAYSGTLASDRNSHGARITARIAF